jgi:hypothetical protein
MNQGQNRVENSPEETPEELDKMFIREITSGKIMPRSGIHVPKYDPSNPAYCQADRSEDRYCEQHGI